MPRGRKKGAKNVSTLWRELEKRMSRDIALDGVDPLHVIEWAMRYFFGLAQTGREAGAPLEEVRKCVREAAQLAGLAAPYRHPRLSAVKHIEHVTAGNAVDGAATPLRYDMQPQQAFSAFDGSRPIGLFTVALDKLRDRALHGIKPGNAELRFLVAWVTALSNST